MKKVITESDIRKSIFKILKEMDLSNIQPQKALFGPIEDEVRSKHAKIMNQIEALENAAMQLDSVIPALEKADKEIKEKFAGIKGPVTDERYGMYLSYIFAEPIPYDNENDTYGDNYDYLEDDIKEMFPELIQECIDVYVKENKDNTARVGFQISIDIDSLEGWE